MGVANVITGAPAKRTASADTVSGDAAALMTEAQPTSPVTPETRRVGGTRPTPGAGSSRSRDRDENRNERSSGTLNSPKQIALVRRKIPYLVTASAGVTMKSDPSQFSKAASTSRGTTMPEGESLSVVGRMEHPEEHDCYLLRCVGVNDKDGWICEQASNGRVAVVPSTDDKIVGTRIVRWSLAPAKDSGWWWFSKPSKQFRLVMHFELQYPRDHVVRIARDIDDVLKMRDAIASTNLNKKLSFVSFPLAFAALDGTDAMVNDVMALLSFMDVIVEWISHIVRKSEFHRVEEVKRFIRPSEEDRHNADNDLMATGGFGGAYPNEMHWAGMESLA